MYCTYAFTLFRTFDILFDNYDKCPYLWNLWIPKSCYFTFKNYRTEIGLRRRISWIYRLVIIWFNITTDTTHQTILTELYRCVKSVRHGVYITFHRETTCKYMNYLVLVIRCGVWDCYSSPPSYSVYGCSFGSFQLYSYSSSAMQWSPCFLWP